MYAIFKNNRRTVRATFGSYEKARQHLRKMFRRIGREAYLTDSERTGAYVLWDEISRNPTAFSHLGYAIRTVA